MPICGDSLNIINGECDLGENPGCLTDCSGPHSCYDCTGGYGTADPLVCIDKC